MLFVFRGNVYADHKNFCKLMATQQYFSQILDQKESIQTMDLMESASHAHTDSDFFDLCFKLAEEAYNSQEVPVGCVFVFNDKVIGKGFNEVNKTKNPTRHAEFVAIEEADKWCTLNNQHFKQVMRQSTVYVNLEPCIMCASALYQLRIRRLVFGAKNPRFGGISSVASNAEYGHEHEIQIVGEIEKEKCIALLRTFYDRENPFAPEEKRKTKNI